MVSECRSQPLPLAEPALHSIICQDSALRLGIRASKYTLVSKDLWKMEKAWDHSSWEWTDGRRSSWVDELIGYLHWFHISVHPTSTWRHIHDLPPCFCAFVYYCKHKLRSTNRGGPGISTNRFPQSNGCLLVKSTEYQTLLTNGSG